MAVFLERSDEGRTPGRTAPPRLARAGAIAWALIGITLLILFAGWAAGRLMPVILPFAIALLISALLRPVADAIQRAGVPRALAVGLTLLGLLAAVVALALLVVPPFVARVADVGTRVEEGARQVAYSVGRDVAGMDRADVDRALTDAIGSLRGRAGALAGNAVSGATTVAGILAATVLVLFLTFFLLKDGRRLWEWLLALAPGRRRDWLDGAGEKSWRALQTYMRGVVFVATIDAVCIGIALLIIGVPLALPLIVLTWFAAFFPIVGAVVAGVAAILVTLVAQGTGAAIVVTVVIVAVQQLEGNVLYPVVVGPRLRLHPVVVLLAVAAGGTIAGLAGAFLAVPVATVASTVLQHARQTTTDPPSAPSTVPVIHPTPDRAD